MLRLLFDHFKCIEMEEIFQKKPFIWFVVQCYLILLYSSLWNCFWSASDLCFPGYDQFSWSVHIITTTTRECTIILLCADMVCWISLVRTTTLKELNLILTHFSDLILSWFTISTEYSSRYSIHVFAINIFDIRDILYLEISEPVT